MPTNLTEIISMFIKIGLKLIPFLAVVALFVFLIGVARFIKASGNEKELKDSKNLLVWGVIGLLVMTSIWGIISFFSSEFNFGGSAVIPQIKFQSTTN